LVKHFVTDILECDPKSTIIYDKIIEGYIAIEYINDKSIFEEKSVSQLPEEGEAAEMFGND
tara:strand:- start:717 stop:899 length:183 start_codon:yes stop_codon:yes gene_type:complete